MLPCAIPDDADEYSGIDSRVFDVQGRIERKDKFAFVPIARVGSLDVTP